MKMKHIVILLAIAIGLCGCHTIDLSSIPAYEKNIKAIRCIDGFDYEIKLRLCRQVTRDQKYYKMYLSEVEQEMIQLVKDEGLYVNQIKYVKDGKFDDTYIIVEASAKPTKIDDWAERKEHERIKNIKKILTAAKDLECKCRYCTSGLDSKFHY